jgi:hypothetical protein
LRFGYRWTPKDARRRANAIARADVRLAPGPVLEATMFRVDVEILEAYFAFDPKREADLRRLDALITKAAPCLKRYFHKGTPAGEPGMRFKMIGYGKSFYHATTGEKVEWPPSSA